MDEGELVFLEEIKSFNGIYPLVTQHSSRRYKGFKKRLKMRKERQNGNHTKQKSATHTFAFLPTPWIELLDILKKYPP